MKAIPCDMRLFRELVGEVLSRGERATFRVTGKSMHPTIKHGEVVSVGGVPRGGPMPGEIIVFRRAHSLCVHRVAGVERDSAGNVLRLLTAGDGRATTDGLCDVEDVMGVVLEVKTSRGTWRPGAPVRKAQGRVRAFLALHPGVRRPLRALKRATTLAGFRARVQATVDGASNEETGATNEGACS